MDEVVHSDGYTVLKEAASQGHLDVVKLLLKNGAKIDAQRLDGRK